MKTTTLTESSISHLVASLPLGVVLLDDDFRYIDANPAWCEMTGYSKSELQALTFAEITHPDDIDIDLELSEAVFAGDVPFFKIDKRWIRKDGDTLYGTLTATVLRQEDKEPVGFAVISPSAESSEAPSEAVLAHELRNLLVVIGGNAELLHLKAEESAKHNVEAIQDAVQLASSITENALAAAGSSESGDCDLGHVVRTCLAMMSVPLLSVSVQTELPAGVVGRISETELMQVVVNLLKNSLEANASRIEVTLRTDGALAEVQVTDDGVGMSDDFLSRAAQPFVSGRHGKGSGLGLAIVEEILGRHSGELRIRRNADRGVTAVASIPMT